MKWYINLPADMDRGNAKNHGPEIRIKATRTGRSWTSSHTRSARWNTTWAPATHDNYFVDAPTFTTGTVVNPTTKDAPEVKSRFENNLKVPKVGGVTYTVQVRKAPGQGANNVNLDADYEATRLLYYKVNFMNTACRTRFEGIEAKWKQIFADAGIELEERGRREKMKGADEACTVRDPTDSTFPARHAGTLDRTPYHLRILLVNDIAEEKDETLTLNVTGTTRTADVEYAGTTIKVKTHKTLSSLAKGFKVQTLTLKCDEATVDVLPGSITPDDSLGAYGGFRVDMSAPPALLAIHDASVAQQRVAVQGTFRGRRAGDVPFQVDLTSATTDQQPAVSGTIQAWVAGDTIVINTTDQARDLATKATRNATLKVDGQDAGYISLNAGARSAKQVAYTLSGRGADAVRDGLAAGKTVSLAATAVLLDADADYPFSGVLRQANMYTGGTACGLNMVYRRLQIIADGIQPTGIRDVKLTAATTLDATPHLAVPGLATFSGDCSEIGIDVSKPQLAAAKTSIDAGRSVEVVVKYAWNSSLGGYYTQGTNVLVLTTIKVDPQELDTVTDKRMLLVACHEVGHALGLVRTDQAMTGGGVEDNLLDYTEMGGKGTHCKLNARPNQAGDKMEPNNGQARLCIMFHTLAYLAQMDEAFCDVCKNHLIRNDVKLSA